MIRFAILGQKATASEEFLLDDLPGSSGRLDVLLRCLRAALLSSHGLRRDVVVYLVLLGGGGGGGGGDGDAGAGSSPLAPRVMRVDGSRVQFLRPDERSLAVLAKKVLASRADDAKSDFVEIKPGIALARGSIDIVLADAKTATSNVFVLDEGAPDLRSAEIAVDGDDADPLFVLGDHLGIPLEVIAKLDGIGARRISVGPVSIHADDVVAIVTNEVDRRKVID